MTNDNKVVNLDCLTGLRFIAAMMIVFHHAKLYMPWDWLKVIPSTFVQGVSFFFVLSGFILTYVYNSKPFPGYFQFLRARIARLIPVHYFAILILAIFIRSDSITFDGPGIFNKWMQLGFNITLTHALIPFTSYAFSWNAVSWSISTEMFFYLTFPFLLTNIKKNHLWKLLGALICVVFTVVGLYLFNIPSNEELNEINLFSILYPNPLVRSFEFCLGMSTWVIWDTYIKSSKLSFFAWSLLEGFTILATIIWLFKGYYIIFPHVYFASIRILFEYSGSFWIFALLILILASGKGFFGYFLSSRVLVFGGEISFSIYMLHQILMKFFAGWLPEGAVSPAMLFFALLFVASGSYIMIEKPAREFLMSSKTGLSS